MKMSNFYIVNVYSREGNYSFMVCSEESLTTAEVLNRCKDKQLFYENRDARDAYVDSNPMTEDIVRFKVSANI